MNHGYIVRGRIHEDGPFYPQQYVPPGGVPMVDADPLTDEQVAQLKAAWLSQQNGPPKILTPLPRRTRIRLAFWRSVGRLAAWLWDHRMHRAAEWLWLL